MDNPYADNPLAAGDQIKKVAEAADISVEAAAKLGRFVDTAFGSTISNGIGLIADRLAYYRLEKAIHLQEKVERRLKEKGVNAKRFVPVSFGLPLLEKASVEDNESLHDKWANLLANAMDPSYSGPITRNFVSILADFEPVDVRLLDAVMRQQTGLRKTKSELLVLERVRSHLSLSKEDCENSVRNLFRLGLLKPGVIETPGIQMGGYTPTIYKDPEVFDTTQLGHAFYNAVTV